MFSPTYHEGTILTIFMSHWHRAIYFIVNLVVYSNDTWIGGIHIFNSLFRPIYFPNSLWVNGWRFCYEHWNIWLVVLDSISVYIEPSPFPQ